MVKSMIFLLAFEASNLNYKELTQENLYRLWQFLVPLWHQVPKIYYGDPTDKVSGLARHRRRVQAHTCTNPVPFVPYQPDRQEKRDFYINIIALVANDPFASALVLNVSNTADRRPWYATSTQKPPSNDHGSLEDELRTAFASIDAMFPDTETRMYAETVQVGEFVDSWDESIYQDLGFNPLVS